MSSRAFAAWLSLSRKGRTHDRARIRQKQRRKWSSAGSPDLEFLERRTLLSVTAVLGANSVTFRSSDGYDHLYLDVQQGVLQFNTDGGNAYTSVGYTLSPGSTTTIKYQTASGGDVAGDLTIVGMDQGGATITTAGAVVVAGDVSTLGGDLSLTGATVAISEAVTVLGSTGTLTTAGGAVYTITGTNADAQTITVTSTPGAAPLGEGQWVAYHGPNSGQLVDGTAYAVDVVTSGNPTTIQLKDAAVISTASAGGSAGNLTLTASSITVGGYARLNARAAGGAGDITLSASSTDTGQTYFALINQFKDAVNPSFTATIDVNQGASLVGGDVTISSEAGTNSLFGNASQAGTVAAGLLGSPLANYLNQFAALPITVLKTTATATAELHPDVLISSSGMVKITSSATANSTGEATYWERTLGGVVGVAFAFAKANTTAKTLIDQNVIITSESDVAVESITSTTTSSTSLVSQNTNLRPDNADTVLFSIGYNDLETTCHTTVSQGAEITSLSGNVDVTATASDSNGLNVQTTSYREGRVGLVGAGAKVNADVDCTVDGTIIAAGRATGGTIKVNPLLSDTFAASGPGLDDAPRIDYAGSRFVFASDPGYRTGQALTYSSGLGGPIRGLANGATYRAIFSNNATPSTPATRFYVQLAASASDAMAGKSLAFGRYPTLDGLPITQFDRLHNQLLYNFDPGFTEGMLVTFAPAAGQFLGRSDSNGGLVPLSGSYKVHIVNATIDGVSQYAIQLLDPATNAVVPLDDSAYLAAADGAVLPIRGFNTSLGLVIFDRDRLPAGSNPSNGDALTYHAGLAADVPGLVDGTTYYAVVDTTQFKDVTSGYPPTIQLAATLEDARAANPVKQLPTLSWTDASGVAHSSKIISAAAAESSLLVNADHAFVIVASDPNSLTLTLSPAPGATPSSLTEGEQFTYQGAAGSEGTLRNGRLYGVHVVDASNPNAIRVQVRDLLRVPTLGSLVQSGGGQSFSILGVVAGSNVVDVQLAGSGSFTPLVDGELLVYHGASIAGYLLDGQAYHVQVFDQDDPEYIELQLTAAYPVTPTGQLLGSGHSYAITSSDPNTLTLTLARQAGATSPSLAQGEVLTYQGPAIASPGYLQPGQGYVVDVLDQSNLDQIQVKLISASAQVGTGGLLQGTGQTLRIVSGDAATGFVTATLLDQSEFTTLAEGATFVYQGASGNGVNTLQNGQSYTIHGINQTNLQAVTFLLKTVEQQAGYGVLNSAGGSYVIHQSDGSTGGLKLSLIGSATALTDGEIVTFQGTSGGAGQLQDGATYSVVVVEQTDSANVLIKLAVYQAPTFGRLAGTGHSYSIQGFDPTSLAVTLRLDPGSSVPSLVEGEALLYTGSALAGTSLLQNGGSFIVDVVDQSNSQAVVVRLLDLDGPLVVDSSDDGVNPSSSILFLDDGSTVIPDGSTVTYHAGGPGTSIGGLTDGATYRLVSSPSDPTQVGLSSLAGGRVALSLDEGLVSNGITYSIVGSDGSHHALELGAAGAPSLVEGQTVIYRGSLNASNASLVDGATYTVHLPAPNRPEFVQLMDSSGRLLSLQSHIRFGTLDQSFMSGATHTLASQSTEGVTISATLTSSEGMSVYAAIGSEPLYRKRAPFGSASAPSAPIAAPAGGGPAADSIDALAGRDGAAGEASSFLSSIAGLLSITGASLTAKITNSCLVNIGSTAVVKSSGNLTISAELTEDNHNSAAAGTSRSKNETKLTVAAAIFVESLDTTVRADVAGGATLDAAGDLAVTAELKYPWVGQINNPNGFDPAKMFGQNLITNIEKFFDSTLGIQSGLVSNWADAAANSSNHPANVSGSVNWVVYTNDCEATVGAGARLNQGTDPAYQGASRSVSVMATTTVQVFNFAGNTGFDFLPADLIKAYKQEKDGGWGGVADTIAPPTQGKDAGTGASLIVLVMTNTTKAVIEGADTKIAFGSGGFNVEADQEVLLIDLGTSGGVGASGLKSGGKFGANGTFSYVNAETTVLAQVGDGATVLSVPSTNGTANVTAADTFVVVAVSGSVVKGDSAGIGVSGVVAELKRTTQAIVGAAPGSSTPAASSWVLGGPLTVSAQDDGYLVGLVLASARSNPTQGAAAGRAAVRAPGSLNSRGVGVSGDASYLRSENNVSALINDSGSFLSRESNDASPTSNQALSVSASDKTVFAGFAGGYSSERSTEESTTSLSIGGSFSEIDLSGDVAASVTGPSLDLLGGLAVSAERDNYLGTLTLAASGAPNKRGWAVAGSVSLGFFEGSTTASLIDVSGTVAGDLEVSATDETIYVALGGSVLSGGKNGLGVSFGYNSIVHDITAAIEGTVLHATGDVKVEACATTAIGTLGLAFDYTQGGEGISGAGDIAVNVIELNLDAHVAKDSNLTVDGGMTVTALDDSYLVSVSGGLAFASNATVGVGAAVSYNLITNTIQAYLDDSTVTVNGEDENGVSLAVSAVSSPMLITMAAGLDGAGSVSIGGSIAINSVSNTVLAAIRAGSSATTDKDLEVSATESALLVVVAGGIGVAMGGETGTGKAAVGAAITYNYVGQSFDSANPNVADHSDTGGSSCSAIIDASTITVGGGLTLASGFQPDSPLPGATNAVIDDQTGYGTVLQVPVSVDSQLVSVGVGGALADDFALGGSLTLAFSRQTITASISGNSRVNASNDVDISAIDDSSIGNGAGGFAFALNTASVGAAVASNDVQNSLTASIEGSSVQSNAGSISIVAEEKAEVTVVALGGSGGSGFALGGSVVVAVIENTIAATIDGSTATAASDVLVSSGDQSQINIGSGQFAITTGRATVGAAVAVSVLGGTNASSIDGSSITSTSGSTQLLASGRQTIVSIAAGGDGAAGFALGGSVVVNTHSQTTTAEVEDTSKSPTITTGVGGLTVSATDSSTIKAGAGQLTISAGNSAVGAAIAVNRIDNTVGATITGATVTSSGDVSVTANAGETITAVALGVGGAVADGFFSVDLVGSGAGNRITRSTKARIEDGSAVTLQNGADLTVSAEDSPSILAIAGMISIDFALGEKGPTAAVGASAALNEIGDSTRSDSATLEAAIDGSTVTGALSLTVSASESASIGAYTVAGSGSFTGGEGVKVGFAGAGSGSGNAITTNTHAGVINGSSVATSSGDFTLSATSDLSIKAVAGGLAFAGAVGSGTGVAVTFGAAAAVNTVQADTTAEISGSQGTSAGAVGLWATNSSSIEAYAVGVAGALAVGDEAGVAVGGAGSGASNQVTQNTTASIAGTPSNSITTPAIVKSGWSGGSSIPGSSAGVSLSATETTSLVAAAGAAALVIGGSGGGASASVAVGVSVALNTETNAITAGIDTARVDAAGDVAATASILPPTGANSVRGVAVAGGVGFSLGDGLSVAFPLFGAGVGNQITNSVEASITHCAGTVQGVELGVDSRQGNVLLSASDKSSITGDGGGADLAVALGGLGVAAAVAAGIAENTIQNTTTAEVQASTATAAGRVAVSASSTPKINGLALGVALAASSDVASATLAGSGASATNTITNTITALVSGGSTITANSTASNAVSVSAMDGAKITTQVSAGFLGVTETVGGGELAVGAVLGSNQIQNAITAAIGAASGTDSTTVRSNGGVDVVASSAGDVEAFGLAVVATITVSEAGAAFSGSGASLTNTIENQITAAIRGGADVDASGSSADDSVDVSATSDMTINASVGAGSLSVAVVGASIGASLATSTVENTVTATIDQATVSTNGEDVNVLAQSMNSLDTRSVATSVSLAIGGAAAGSSATSKETTSTSASVDSGSTIRTTSRGGPGRTMFGNLSIKAGASDSTLNAESDGGTLGVAVIGVFLADVEMGGSTQASLAAGSTLMVGGLTIEADATHTSRSSAIGVGVGSAGVGGTGATTNVTHQVSAWMGARPGATPRSTATLYALNGSLVLTATADETGSAEADSGLAGVLGAISGNAAHATVSPAVIASISDDVDVQTSGGVTVQAAATNHSKSDVLGIVVSSLAVGVSDAKAANAGSVEASIGDVQLNVGGALTVSADADETAETSSQSSGGAALLSVNGATAVSSIGSTVSASLGEAAATVGGDLKVASTRTPFAKAKAYGISVSGTLAVGVVKSSATVAGDVTAEVGDGSSISAASLLVQAAQGPGADSSGAFTASAESTSGAGGVLSGIDATAAEASMSGNLTAQVGSNVSLPDGDASILATHVGAQSATATAVSAGLFFAAGGSTATSSSEVATKATLGSNASTSSSRSGDVTVISSGRDSNSVDVTAGSGGFVSGSAAVGKTNNTSSASAAAGGSIRAGDITVSALEEGDYAINLDSVNATVVGGSGASGDNTVKTSAAVTLGGDTNFTATGLITILAQNTIEETTQGDSVSGGAGGVVSGTAAVNHATLTGNATTTIGDGARFSSGVSPTSSPGGIAVLAKNVLLAIDEVTLSTGGIIQGAGTDSTITATLTNLVSVGNSTQWTSWGDLGIGSVVDAEVETSSSVSTGGLAAVGTASATTKITSNQTVSIGANSTMTAFGDLQVSAGDDPTTQTGSIVDGDAQGQGFIYGAIAIPSVSATSTVVSNTTLTINSGAVLNSGRNAMIGADPGDATATAEFTSHGFELGFIPFTATGGDHTATPTSTVTNNGTINAGIYHQMTIVVAADGSTQINQGLNPAVAYIAPAPLFSTGTFLPQTYVTRYFTPSEAALLNSGVSGSSVGQLVLGPQGGAFGSNQVASASNSTNPNSIDLAYNPGWKTGDTVVYQAPAGASIQGLTSGATYHALIDAAHPTLVKLSASAGGPALAFQSSGGSGQTLSLVGAMPLYASGGAVSVHADSLSGSGRYNAYGGPSITVTNTSPLYLLLGSVTLVNDPGAGLVNFTGKASSTNTSSNGAQSLPSVAINQTYSSAVGSVSYGPAVFLTGAIDNPGGTVSITNAAGAYGQFGTINATQTTLKIAQGPAVIDTPSAAYPSNVQEASWHTQMIWPGGDPYSSSYNQAGNDVSHTSYTHGNPTGAITYVVNALYNKTGSVSQSTLNSNLYGSSIGSPGPNNTVKGSIVFIGDSFPYATGSDSSLDQNTTWTKAAGNSSGTPYKIASAYTGAYFPTIPTVSLTKSISTSSVVMPASFPSSIFGGGVSITAATIDLNGGITAGRPTTNRSVVLSAALGDTLRAFQTSYDQGDEPSPSYAISSSQLSVVGSGDQVISATYDARSRRIVLDDVSATLQGGYVYLQGKIINTNTVGKIKFNDGLGGVTIKNQSGIELVVGDVDGGAGATSRLEIIDTNQPSTSNHTLYVHQPGGPIQVYTGGQTAVLGTGAPSSTIAGSTTSFSPRSGSRWYWTTTANLQRSLTVSFPNSSLTTDSPSIANGWISPWQWVMPTTNQSAPPWTTSSGYVGIDTSSTSTAFSQTIRGGVSTLQLPASLPAYGAIKASGHSSDDTLISYFPYQYLNNDLGYNNFGSTHDHQNFWYYYWPLKASLELDDSIKADYPISVDFSTVTSGSFTVESNAPVHLAGSIRLPSGSAAITAAAALTAGPHASLSASGLTLSVSGDKGRIGERARPLPFALAAGGVLTATAGGGGVYLSSTSTSAWVLGGITAGSAAAGYGDVVLSSTSDIATAAGSPATADVVGKNIRLASKQGAVGSSSDFLVVLAHSLSSATGGDFEGVVDVSALNDVYLRETGGSLLVGLIQSTTGNVSLDAPDGDILDADGWITLEASLDEAKTRWGRAHVSGDSAYAQLALQALQSSINAAYQQYWQLLSNGTKSGGGLTLNSTGLALFQSQAAAALKVSNPTTQQVQSYANGIYNNLVQRFDAYLPAGWPSLPDFLAFNVGFAFQASAALQATLASPTTWTLDQLRYVLDREAALSSPSRSASTAVNVSAATIALTAGGSIGRLDPAVGISRSDLQAPSLTSAQRSALIHAASSGEALIEGVDASGALVRFAVNAIPAGVNPTGVVIALDRPLKVGSSFVTATANRGVNLAAPGGSLGVGGIDGGDGGVKLTARDDVLAGSVVGDALTSRANRDSQSGQVYLSTKTFSGSQTPATLSFVANAIGHSITPLVFAAANGAYTLAAVYQSISVTSTGTQTAPLTLLQGALSAGSQYVFGFSDRAVALSNGQIQLTSSYTGTVGSDTKNDGTGTWLFTALGSAPNLALGSKFTAAGSSGTLKLQSGRIYSASVTTVSNEEIVSGKDFDFSGGGTVGNPLASLAIQSPAGASGLVNAQGPSGVYLSSAGSSLQVGRVSALHGEASLAAAGSILAGATRVLGDAPIDRDVTDLFPGQVYLSTQTFSGSELPRSISFRARAVNQWVTPLAFQVTGGAYRVAVLYQPVHVTQAGVVAAALTAYQGSLDPTATYAFGFSDRWVPTDGSSTPPTISTGTIPFDFIDRGDWLYTVTSGTSGPDLGVGAVFSEGAGVAPLASGRVYSASFLVDSPGVAAQSVVQAPAVSLTSGGAVGALNQPIYISNNQSTIIDVNVDAATGVYLSQARGTLRAGRISSPAGSIRLNVGSADHGEDQSTSEVVVGDPAVANANTDSYSGQVYIHNQTFQGKYVPAKMTAYVQSVGFWLTPLVFRVSGGAYTLAAVYQSVLTDRVGEGEWDLALLQGGLDASSEYAFGFSDRQVAAGASGPLTTTSMNKGTVPFANNSSGHWLYTATSAGSGPTLALNSTFVAPGSGGGVPLNIGRIYSASITASFRSESPITAGADALISGGDVGLVASGAIGSATAPIPIAGVGGSTTLDASAFEGVYVSLTQGSANLGRIESQEGDVVITATAQTGQDLSTGADSLLTAVLGDITLLATGSINLGPGGSVSGHDLDIEAGVAVGTMAASVAGQAAALSVRIASDSSSPGSARPGGLVQLLAAIRAGLVRVRGGAGDDSVVVDLGGLRADLAVDGVGGDDRLQLTGSSAEQNFLIDGAAVRLDDGRSITFQRVERQAIQAATSAAFQVLRTLPGTSLTLAGGPGPNGNRYRLGSAVDGAAGTLDALQGVIHLQGGSAVDSIEVDDRGARDGLGRPAASGYFISSSRINRLTVIGLPARVGFAGVTYDSAIANLHLMGSKGMGSTLVVKPSRTTTYQLDGGGSGGRPDSRLRVVLSKELRHRLARSRSGQGTVSFGEVYRPMRFAGISAFQRVNIGVSARTSPVTQADRLATIRLRFRGFTSAERSAITSDPDSIRVLGPGGTPAELKLVQVAPTADGLTLQATFEASTSTGRWSRRDNGQYRIAIAPGSIRDDAGQSVLGGVIGRFQVRVNSRS